MDGNDHKVLIKDIEHYPFALTIDKVGFMPLVLLGLYFSSGHYSINGVLPHFNVIDVSNSVFAQIPLH